MGELQKEVIAGVFSVIVALISLSGVLWSKKRERISREELATALEEAMTTIAEQEAQLQQHNSILNSQSNAMHYEHQFALNTNRHLRFQAICEETEEIDRIFAFIAWNGAGEPQRTTAIYHLRFGEQMQLDFKYQPIDDHYRDMLREVERVPGGKTYRTQDLPEGVLLETIYRTEGVKAAHVIILRKKTYDEGVCISYLSFASHNTSEISAATLFRLQTEVFEMRDEAENLLPKVVG